MIIITATLYQSIPDRIWLTMAAFLLNLSKHRLNKHSYDEAKCSRLKVCRESKQEPVI